VEVVPLCALLSARPIAALVASAPGRGLVLTLALLGMMVQIPGVYLGAFRWNDIHAASHREAVWSWSQAPFLVPFTVLRR
jgi:hypothetical protein